MSLKASSVVPMVGVNTCSNCHANTASRRIPPSVLAAASSSSASVAEHEAANPFPDKPRPPQALASGFVPLQSSTTSSAIDTCIYRYL